MIIRGGSIIIRLTTVYQTGALQIPDDSRVIKDNRVAVIETDAFLLKSCNVRCCWPKFVLKI